MTKTGSPDAPIASVATLPSRPSAGATETVIRPYADADAGAVAALWRASAPEWPGGGPFGGKHATAEGIRHEQRARHPLETFIAWRPDPATGDPAAVGYCSLLAQPDDASATYVGLLTADPAWHGTGVGRDLLVAAIERTIEVGRDRVDLHTWSGNLKAVPLYKKVGFFWVPDTSVRMANFLPLLMRIGPVRAFFASTGADWYADAVRTLDLSPDLDRRGAAEVYRYAWERGGKRLEATIDRHANALVALSTPDLDVSIALDDPRIPTGTRRTATFRLAVPDGCPDVTATFVASGTGAIRSARQSHQTVSAGRVAEVAWPVEGVLSGPPPKPRQGMASPDLVRVLAVIDDEPITLACATRVVPPVSLAIDDVTPIIPGQARAAWLTVENETGDDISATVRATATGPFTVHLGSAAISSSQDGSGPRTAAALAPEGEASFSPLPRGWEFSAGVGGLAKLDAAPAGCIVHLPPRARIAVPVRLQATGTGSGTLHVNGSHGDSSPATASVPLHAGDAGAIFVDQTDAHVRVTTDTLVVTVPLANSGWQPTFSVADRHTGRALLRHACGLGPPFSPSPISASTWTPTVNHEAGAVAIVLRASPDELPGISFERHVRVAGSGLVDVRYRLVNGSDAPLTFDVGTGTSAELDGIRHTRIACVVDGMVIDDESDAFPDWEDPSGGASRLTEGWIAEYGDGMVVGAIWTDAADVHGDGRLAELVLPLGTVAPGDASTTATLRLYVGPGDWHAVRARWRAFTGTGTPPEIEGRPRGVDAARLANPFAIDDLHETEVILARANDQPHDGTVAIIAGNLTTTATKIADLRALAPATAHVAIPVPSRPGAVATATRILTADTVVDLPVALVRVGNRHDTVTTTVDTSGPRAAVTLDTGAMRVRLVPTQRARLVAIETRNRDGEWVDHLLSSEPEPRPWVWFNPWYGGISTHLRETGWHTGHTPLDRATWDWHATTVHRAGITWHGVTSVATITRLDGPVATPDAVERARLAGVSVEVACLVAGGGTAIALEATIRNGSTARLRGSITMPTYWKPGGTTDGTTVHYDRRGPRSRRRDHGARWSATEGWVAIVDAAGTAVPVIVTADARITLMGGDMGLHGVHPFASMPVDLDPGATRALRLWVSVAADLDEARAWRQVVGTPLPPAVTPA